MGAEPLELAKDLTDVTANHQAHKRTKQAYEWLQSVTLCLSLSSWGPQIQEVETGCVFASESMTLVKQFFL